MSCARIIYGVSGEGSGHSSRAREILPHLIEQGHTVKVASYDRGFRNLCDDFDVLEIEGLHIASVENKISVVHTFADNLSRLSEGVKKLRELRELFRSFRPDCVITDFEPMTAHLANHYSLPLITLDNQHRMRYMRYPCSNRLKTEAVVTETVIRAMVPLPDVSLVTTFYFGETTNDRTFLFPPLLRREVLATEPTDGNEILVYFTQPFESFQTMLRDYPRERFLIYGADREDDDGTLSFRPPSRDGFLHDLARCKAVIATAGFTLATEAIHLGKPYLALPMGGQFEQELNALLLEELGYGKNGRDPDRETIGAFLYHLPEYRERLAARPLSNNREIKQKLDELLADDCAVARMFHERRK